METNPSGSNWLILPSRESADRRAAGLLGIRRMSTTRDIAPRGTLIQKHQRQVTAVRYPPKSGPAIEASPNTAPRLPARNQHSHLRTVPYDIPKYFGREWSGTSVLMSRRAPDEMPAPPMPVITRPTIKVADVGAVADMMEPSSNIATSPTSTTIKVNIVSQVDCDLLPYPT